MQHTVCSPTGSAAPTSTVSVPHEPPTGVSPVDIAVVKAEMSLFEHAFDSVADVPVQFAPVNSVTVDVPAHVPPAPAAHVHWQDRPVSSTSVKYCGRAT